MGRSPGRADSRTDRLPDTLLTVRHPLEQLAWLHVEGGTETIERIGGESAELDVGVGQSISSRDGEPRHLREAIRGPSLSLQHGCEVKADHDNGGAREELRIGT